MMLAGLPVPTEAVQELAYLVRVAGADELADRLKVALEGNVKLLALSFDGRALMLAALEDPPDELAGYGRCCSRIISGGAPKGLSDSGCKDFVRPREKSKERPSSFVDATPTEFGAPSGHSRSGLRGGGRRRRVYL